MCIYASWWYTFIDLYVWSIDFLCMYYINFWLVIFEHGVCPILKLHIYYLPSTCRFNVSDLLAFYLYIKDSIIINTHLLMLDITQYLVCS